MFLIFGSGISALLGCKVVKLPLHTCILFAGDCTAMLTGHLTCSIGFDFCLFVVVVPNFGCVGLLYTEYYVLQLCRLVVKANYRFTGFGTSGGEVTLLLYFEPACAA